MKNSSYIQRVTEISTLILTGNRTRQKEQLFYLPFCRKTMFNSKKKIGEIFHIQGGPDITCQKNSGSLEGSNKSKKPPFVRSKIMGIN
jgi:hypothetical protein